MGRQGRAQIRIACPGPGLGPQTGPEFVTETGSVTQTVPVARTVTTEGMRAA